MNTQFSPIRSMKPVGSRTIRRVGLDSRERENDAAIGQRPADLLTGVDCCQVNLDVGLGIQQEPLDRKVRSVDRGQRAALEVFGVGEEERLVVAIDQQARHLAAGGVIVDIVHAGQPQTQPKMPSCGQSSVELAAEEELTRLGGRGAGVAAGLSVQVQRPKRNQRLRE